MRRDERHYAILPRYVDQIISMLRCRLLSASAAVDARHVRRRQTTMS